MKKIAKFIYILMMIGILYLGSMSAFLTYFGKYTVGKPSDCIIVLGAAEWNGKPSPAMRERLDVAYETYRKGLASTIIVSGGVGLGTLSEAEVMKEYLVKRGIPSSFIIEENQSKSTLENISYSKKNMEQHGFKSAILVTHGFHAFRSYVMAWREGISPSVETVKVTPLNVSYYTLRECGGMAWLIVYHLWEEIV